MKRDVGNYDEGFKAFDINKHILRIVVENHL